MHKVHFLSLVGSGSRKGWQAPVELPSEQPREGALVVPVTRQMDFFPLYRLGWSAYRGAGRFDHSSTLMKPTGRGLSASIDGRTVTFRMRLVDGQPVLGRYLGLLKHPDFAHPLCEIEAEDDALVDLLFDQSGIVLSGCDPESEYGGLKEFLASSAGQVRIV